MIIADELAKKLFGRTQEEAWQRRICVSCGTQMLHRDDVGRREYMISALCPKCFHAQINGRGS